MTKAASHGKSEKDALQLTAEMSSPSSSALLLNLSPRRAFAQSPTFPCLSTVEHGGIGSTGSTEGERVDEEEEEESEEANASRRNASAPAPR